MPHIDGKCDELTFKVLFILSDILLDIGTHLLKSIWGLEGHTAEGIDKAVDIYLAIGAISCWLIGC